MVTNTKGFGWKKGVEVGCGMSFEKMGCGDGSWEYG